MLSVHELFFVAIWLAFMMPAHGPPGLEFVLKKP
jgi:hypothetical protein